MLKDSMVFSGFSVDNLEKAKEFYGQTLGLDVSDNPMGLLDINFTNGTKAIIYPKSDHVPATFTILNFLVENIDKTFNEMKGVGITFEHYEDMGMDEKNIARGKEYNRGPNIAWLKDPAGNILSIIERD